MGSSQKERMIPMWKKLTALSLSLLICLSLLPAQAGAMDAAEDDPPVQVEDVENQVSPEDPDAGIAPCHVVSDAGLKFGGSGNGGGHNPPVNIPNNPANGRPQFP